jgi:hypothetical protein
MGIVFGGIICGLIVQIMGYVLFDATTVEGFILFFLALITFHVQKGNE